MAYLGQKIPLQLNRFGLVGSRNPASTPPGAFLRHTNCAWNKTTLTREGGSDEYNATPITGAPQITAMHDWWPTDAVQRLIIAVNTGAETQLLRDTGAGTFGTTLKTGLSNGAFHIWCGGGREIFTNNRKLFLATGTNAVQVLSGDGVTTADIGANKPLDWSGSDQPIALLNHNLKLWGIFDTFLYGSTDTDHENFQGAGSVFHPVYPGHGLGLRGFCSYKELMYLWKHPRGIYLLDDSSFDVRNWRTTRLTSGIGLAGPDAHTGTDDESFFMSEVGHIHMLSRIREGDVSASDVTAANELVDWTRETLDIDSGALYRVQARWYPEKREVHFGVPLKGASGTNARLVIDLNKQVDGKPFPRIRFSDKDVSRSLAVRRDGDGIERLISGDATGTVWLLDRAETSKGGAAYSSEWQTSHDDLGWADQGLRDVRKNFNALEALFEPRGDWDLSIDVILDGRYTQTLLFNMGTGGVGLDTFVLDTDFLADDLVAPRRRRLRGSARRISLIGRMSTAGQDFSLSDLTLWCKPGNTKVSAA